MEQYDARAVIGLDLHRRRSVLVAMTAAGERLGMCRIDNDPQVLAETALGWGEAPQVVLEATYGWYWAADVLADAGCEVFLTHPLGIKGFAYRRVKNDERDAADLADLLRMGRLPQAWIAPPPVRELRELVRHRAKMVALRSGLKAGVHAVLAKHGIAVPMADLFGPSGRRLLEQLTLPEVYAAHIASLRRLITMFDTEIDGFGARITARLAGDDGYRAIQRLDGVGPVLAAVFVAEIGDVHRFRGAPQLCSWAGLTPKHRESDTKVRRGHITKQGSPLVRWAATEAVQRVSRGPLAHTRARVGERRGKGIGTVAAARKLLTLVYYGLRDGHIRVLAPAQPAG
ncbi:IS110 family transposase [Actinoplanes sp. TBRC 11911]|uniref:IS110 family transposase n=1 Tax=Actinoplanes sp. TBRC 11911 TaxID=2729386 RepID=UPI00145DFF37|nr:IS110 family transposase [Actinoplanes sp. TBRC 11911]NMO57910.1 IS110 family transposase [Actinoplanes sp. TBRC 11911]